MHLGIYPFRINLHNRGVNMSVEPTATKQEMRVAIFGAGKMAMNHITAISLQKNARLVAIADPAIEKIKTSNLFSFDVPVFSDPEDLLSKIKPDIVHICSPPETHFRLSELALRHKANIYVEKPFTLNVRDAKDVISLADEFGLRICAGHQLLFEEPTRKAQSYMAKIGRIVHVESYFSYNPVRGSRDGRAGISPLDQLVDILPHPVYLLLHFMKFYSSAGKPKAVQMEALHVNTRGTVHAVFHSQEGTGSLYVTLEGRPIESYLKIVGTNGSVYSDFVRGTSSILAGPGTSGISKVINPYSQSWQTVAGTTRSLLKRVFRKQKSYPGLVEIIRDFYDSVMSGKPMDAAYEAILETVSICEEITGRLRKVEADEAELAGRDLIEAESKLPPVDSTRGGILVTGGTGFLGNPACAELRKAGWRTRAISRSFPLASRKIPGVEYSTADLGDGIPTDIFDGISIVVHCAAETSGGKEAHARNSVESTRNVLDAMAKAGVKKFIHISSNAVLMTSGETGSPVDENTLLVPENENRGPYVWGKVKSENLARTMCDQLGIAIRVIRPGALVDYNDFEAPGRLGREVGPFFICIGNRKSRIGICDVLKAAKVIRLYAEDFDNMPMFLNLIEPESPKHAELISFLLKKRPELKVIYFPLILLRLMSPGLKVFQKILRPGHKPINVYSVFAPEKYNNDLVIKILEKIDKEVKYNDKILQ